MSTPQPVEFTEEEQGRYDRQIRLWGIEAQQRMRNATILVIKLRGTATEAIKNIVLAGIGKLIIVDDENVSEEDLGAGFFFRDDDVGTKRAEAAKARVESLNPLVAVETISTLDVLSDDQKIATTVRVADLVCVTDCDRDTLIRLNDACRSLGKPFYAGGTFGLLGYIFCDLLNHNYLSPGRAGATDVQVQATAKYVTLRTALEHRWTTLTKRQTKELNPAVLFIILALWDYQCKHEGILPDDAEAATELQSSADHLLSLAGVNKQVLTKIPEDLAKTMTTAASHEFSPVCAIIGGMLAQDILKTLGGREAPLANFFTFDGNTGTGTVCRLNMLP